MTKTKKKLKTKKPLWFCQELHDYVQQRGEQARLARAMGVAAATMSYWVKGMRPVSTAQCLKMARLTGGYVPVHKLRRDVDWSM